MLEPLGVFRVGQEIVAGSIITISVEQIDYGWPRTLRIETDADLMAGDEVAFAAFCGSQAVAGNGVVSESSMTGGTAVVESNGDFRSGILVIGDEGDHSGSITSRADESTSLELPD